MDIRKMVRSLRRKLWRTGILSGFAVTLGTLGIGAVPGIGGNLLAAAAAVTEPISPPQPPEERRLSFSVMSDLHVQAGDPESAERFRGAMRDLADAHPEAELLILNGDLTDGRSEDFERLREVLAEERHPPFYATPGNHEFYRMWLQPDGSMDYGRLSPKWSSRSAVEQFTAFFGYRKPYHALWKRGYLFLFLCGEAYRDEHPDAGEAAWLSQEQLRWVKESLAYNARHNYRKPVFMFLHQPLPDTVDGSGLHQGVVQHRELRRLLDAYPEAVVFSGHTHWDMETTRQVRRDGPLFLGSASVRQVWSGEDRPLPEAKSESLAVDVYGDRIIVRGREHVERRWIGDAYVQFIWPFAELAF